MAGPYPYPEPFPQQPPQQPIPAPAGPTQPYPDYPGSVYPGMLPPPVPYPKRRRWPVVVGVLVVLAVVAGIGTAVVLASRGSDSAPTGVTEQSAQAAIQEYLDALAEGDNETVARHALCGLYDDVNQRRSDLQVANLNSDAFRKQFERAEVTSIDRIVRLSTHQARVLFSMQVTPATGPRAGEPSDTEVQAVAETLYQDNEVLVCNYLVRTGGQY